MDEYHDKHSKLTNLPAHFIPLNAEKFDPNVWGPHYWFFLDTISHTYPQMPNSVTKRKYYDLIQNLPLFIPNPDIGDIFSKILDQYPVSPYLDSRDSFIRWIHFIHNKISQKYQNLLSPPNRMRGVTYIKISYLSFRPLPLHADQSHRWLRPIDHLQR